MDLTQKKLTKAEWRTIEIPVNPAEKEILDLIREGYYNVNLRINNTPTLMSVVKIEDTAENYAVLYKQFFEKDVTQMITQYGDAVGIAKPGSDKMKPPKKADLIRIQSFESKGVLVTADIYEYKLLEYCRELLKQFATSTKGSTVSKSTEKTQKKVFYIYTLIHMLQASVEKPNPTVIDFVKNVVESVKQEITMLDVLENAYECIERNPNLLKYEDLTLFQHQKQLFSTFRQSPSTPKLVLYIAPTGTGKTLSPIGLTGGHRVIFICAARHVGLALAKSAISCGKRIAIAFGCETADDIRLHYHSASAYSLNKKTGAIAKVDNSVGHKVQLMICDVQSYLIAMYYMQSFAPREGHDIPVSLPVKGAPGDKYIQYLPKMDYDDEHEDAARKDDLLLYWDEPTIAMDYETHPLHALIQRNWRENQVSRIVLSSATLPREDEITDSVAHFRQKFGGDQDVEVKTITSYDCRKSISILDKAGNKVVPHLLFREYEQMKECVAYCAENKTLLRYFDFQEILRFIRYMHAHKEAMNPAYDAEHYFSGGIGDITMNRVKIYYLDLLKHAITARVFDALQLENKSVAFHKTTSESGLDRVSSKGAPIHRTQSVGSPPKMTPSPFDGVLLTTKDAHTLTDGPTIFLAENTEKIATFFLQQAAIPPPILGKIRERIAQNRVIQEKIEILTKKMEDQIAALANKEQNKGGDAKDGKKSDKIDYTSHSTETIRAEIDQWRSQIGVTALDKKFVPNTEAHQSVWCHMTDASTRNAYAPTIPESAVYEVMELDVPDDMKLLLLLGIGFFTNEQEANARYLEIMKQMAQSQHLYLIVASSDYIYGTNYQFCHGFIGKDLQNMTQQKTIQAMGRIGRNHIQQTYTVRFRDDAMLAQLFQRPVENREAIIMGRLFQ